MLFILSHSLYASKSNLPPRIEESTIKVLIAENNAVEQSKKSSTSKRRAYKGNIRKAQDLLKQKPTAVNRFHVLALILNAQKKLLSVDNSKRNRDDLYKTCVALAQAPYEYAEFRFDADVLLSDKNLSEKNADAKERIKAFEGMIERYRNTPAELKSLKTIIHIAPKLGAFELKNKLIKSLKERFASSKDAIAFMRKLVGLSRMDITFSGSFKRLDGTTMSFPIDRHGNPYLVIFWSKDQQLSLDKLKQLVTQQKEAPDVFEIYSLNLDELADAGKSIVDEIGLKCTSLHLPLGKQSDTFKTYALFEPSALRVNQFGHAIVPPTKMAHDENEVESKEGMGHLHMAPKFDEFAYPKYIRSPDPHQYDRYLTQIQSLFIGDFLVTKDGQKKSDKMDTINNDTISAIQSFFIPAPMRYRIDELKAFSNYEKAEKLCADIIKNNLKSPFIWQIRNFRIIALIGMASSSAAPKYFNRAVDEARINLKEKLPEGAGIIARFCLAKNSLRESNANSKFIIDDFINHCGADKAPQEAYLAATILALHADNRELYQQNRTLALKFKTSKQNLFAIISFLQNRYHQFYVFRGNPNYYLYSREYRFFERRHKINLSNTPMALETPPFQLKTLDGKTINLPDTKKDKLTLLIFVEPHANGNIELTPHTYALAPKVSKKNKNPQPSGLISLAHRTAQAHLNKSIDVITVILSEDIKKIKAINDKYKLPGLVTTISQALKNPIINQLGVLSADRIGNIFLIRRDGTIAWSKHGIRYQIVRSVAHTNSIAVDTQVYTCDLEAGVKALNNGDYKRAENIFSGPFEVNTSGRAPRAPMHRWTSSQFHGKALALIGLNDHSAALETIRSAISEHTRYFNHDIENPCSSMQHQLKTKAFILETLGRTSEALTAKNKASVPATTYPTYYHRIRGFNEPYERFEDKLNKVFSEIK